MTEYRLADYLSSRRWCSFKEEIKQNRIAQIELDTLPFDLGEKLFTLGKVTTVEGKSIFFSMPLAVAGVHNSEEDVLVLDGKRYVDAVTKEDFWRSFNYLMEKNNNVVEFQSGYRLEHIGMGDEEIPYADTLEDSKPLGVEQSNTSLKIGKEKYVFKLERIPVFAYALNSELEMNAKLMREHSTFAPKTYSGYIWVAPDGSQAPAGIVQEFVPNRGDMWSVMQKYLAEELHKHYEDGTALTPEKHEEFVELFYKLGQKTVEMEKCFATPDEREAFNPEKVEDAYLEKYSRHLKVILYQARRNMGEFSHKMRENIIKEEESAYVRLRANYEERLREIREKEDKLMQEYWDRREKEIRQERENLDKMYKNIYQDVLGKEAPELFDSSAKKEDDLKVVRQAEDLRRRMKEVREENEKKLEEYAAELQRRLEEYKNRSSVRTQRRAEDLLGHWNERVEPFVANKVNSISQAEDKGTINRVHGDFHLGQVIVTNDNDLKFIDFGGEPGLSQEERREKHISVRDTAGMYRSIKGYLGSVAVEDFARQAKDEEEIEARRDWAFKAISPLIKTAAKAFLAGKSLEEPWLGLEVLRKNLYEVNYEVNNRPDMAHIPISGLVDLLSANENEAPENTLGVLAYFQKKKER